MKVKKQTKRLDKDNIVIIIPFWNRSWIQRMLFRTIKKTITKDYGYVFYNFSRDILNEDPFLTRKNFEDFLNDVYNDVEALNKEKKRNIHIYGLSLGTSFSMILADKIEASRVALINPGYNLAESFWNGVGTKYLKDKMEKKGIKIDDLKIVWKDISPDMYFKDKAKNATFYIELSKNDVTIPYENGQKLINLMHEKNIKYNLYTASVFSHRMSILWECFFPIRTIKFLINND